MSPDLDRLPGLIARIELGLATCQAAWGYDEASRSAYRSAIVGLCTELCDLPDRADIINDGTGTRVVMAGIRAHSTTGELGALRNWQAAARSRLEAAGRT